MSDVLQQYFATDKEIFDLLMSTKQRITEKTLHELARDRGIFYSPRATRQELVDCLSVLPHDYDDIAGLIQKREQARRGEKITSITLDAEIGISEIKEVISDYQSESKSSEKVNSYQKGADTLIMNLKYVEIDYSRTSLTQRQPRDASIEFVNKGNKVIVRLPATEKAKDVVSNLKEKIEGKRKQTVATEEIDLSTLNRPEQRTAFFTSLMSEMKDFHTITVTTLKVASGFVDTDADDDELDLGIDEDELEEARERMLAEVRTVSLNGKNLFASPVYQELRSRGFFITSLTWQVKQIVQPYYVLQFEAGFTYPHEGSGFKYGVRYAPMSSGGTVSKIFRPLPEIEKPKYYEAIEIAARIAINKLVADADSPDQDDPK